MSDARQQLLAGIQTDTDSPAGLPLVKVAKGARRGAGQVWGKVLARGIDPSVTAHDVLKTETIGGQLQAIWQHLHLADLPAGSANLVFLEDGSGSPALALIIDANVAAAAGIAYSKLNLAGSIMGTDIAAGQIGGALGNGKITAGSLHTNDVGATAGLDYYKFAQAPVCRTYQNVAVTSTTGALAVIHWVAQYNNNTLYCAWDADTAIYAQRAGTFLCWCNITFPINVTGHREVRIYLNGATIIAANAQIACPAGFSTRISAFCTVPIAASSYIQTYILQSSGGNLTTVSDAISGMGMVYLGP
jgi:hypothetical protein